MARPQGMAGVAALRLRKAPALVMTKVTPHEGTPLKLKKTLFI
jgi:hypothetical protein